MKHIFITGATGFAGTYTVREFLRAGYELTGTYFTNPPPDDLKEKVNWITLDVTHKNEIQDALRHIQPDGIIHLAGLPHVGHSLKDPLPYFEVNALGALWILESVRTLDMKPRILFIGSAEVYGNVTPEENPLHEERPLKPCTPYGASKAWQEIVGLQYWRSYGIPVICTRSFNHIGPGQKLGFVTQDFAYQVARIEAGLQEPILRTGNLHAIRDFTDVRDIARAYRLLYEKGQPGEVYNVCSGKGTSIEEILKLLMDIARLPIRHTIDEEKFRPIDVPVFIGSYEKIYQTVGWEPRLPLRQTLKDILEDWHQKIQ